jgi:hypothetical protein
MIRQDGDAAGSVATDPWTLDDMVETSIASVVDVDWDLDFEALLANPVASQESLGVVVNDKRRAIEANHGRSSAEPCRVPDQSRSRSPSAGSRSTVMSPNRADSRKMSGTVPLAPPLFHGSIAWWATILWNAVAHLRSKMVTESPARRVQMESFCGGMCTEVFGITVYFVCLFVCPFTRTCV